MSPFPAAFSREVRAQSKSVLYSSETVVAVLASEPLIMPALGAVSGMVKTRGSGVGKAPDVGFKGGYVEFRGKRM